MPHYMRGIDRLSSAYASSRLIARSILPIAVIARLMRVVHRRCLRSSVRNSRSTVIECLRFVFVSSLNWYFLMLYNTKFDFTISAKHACFSIGLTNLPSRKKVEKII
jgi:hypothetical protein